MIDIQKLRELAGKATQGPWKVGTPPPNGEQTIGTMQGLMLFVATTGYYSTPIANAKFVAAANPATILSLLARLEAAEKNAARFEWLMCNAQMGIGQWGKEWDLQIADQPFSAPNHIGEVPAFIDAAIKQEKQK